MMRLYFLASIFWLIDSSALQMLILIASALQMRMDRGFVGVFYKSFICEYIMSRSEM